MQTLATAAHANQPGYQYLMTMTDFFEISGPNGRHECLVLELLGPSVADYLDAHSLDERLPGELAKRVVKQTLLGLAFLHERGIAHGGMFMLQYPSFPFICQILIIILVNRSPHPQPRLHHPFAPIPTRRRFPPQTRTPRNSPYPQNRQPTTRVWFTSISRQAHFLPSRYRDIIRTDQNRRLWPIFLTRRISS